MQVLSVVHDDDGGGSQARAAEGWRGASLGGASDDNGGSGCMVVDRYELF